MNVSRNIHSHAHFTLLLLAFIIVAGLGTLPAAAAEAPAGFVAVSAGAASTQALKADGYLYRWGDNAPLQTVTSSTTHARFVSMAAGGGHTLALRSDGSVQALGNDMAGQTVVPDGALSGVAAVAAGAFHSLALKEDGSVLGWGDDSKGQVSVPASAASGVVAIAAGWFHSLALKSDGSVIAWGLDDAHQADVPAVAGSGVVAIAAGAAHTLALKEDGSVVAWGDNSALQCAVPAAASSGVVAIAAGAGHSLALKSDGSVVAWGLNSSGQTGVPASAGGNVTAIAAGGSHSVALRKDGTLVAWGSNQQGQATQWPVTIAPSGALDEGQSLIISADVADTACSWSAALFPGAPCSPGYFFDRTSIVLTAHVPVETGIEWGSGCDASTESTCTVNNLTGGRTIAPTLFAKSPQSIRFNLPTGFTYGQGPIALSATGGASGNPVTFTVAGPGTLDGNTLALTGTGVITVTANQAGNERYTAAPAVVRTISVGKAGAELSFDPASLDASYDGGVKRAVLTTTTTGLNLTDANVTFTYAGSPTPPSSAGSYPVVATLDDPNFEGSASGTLIIAKAIQTITFAPGIPATRIFGEPPVAIHATGGASGQPITFSVQGPAALSGNSLSFTGAGTVTVSAHQAGNANYAAAEAWKTIAVAKAPAVLTLEPASLHQTYDGTPRSVLLTTTTPGLSLSPANVVYSYAGASSAPSSAGSYPVTATLEDANFDGSATGTLVVERAGQTVVFAEATPATMTYGDAPVKLAATGGASGNHVTFTVTGGPGRIDGNMLIVTGAGAITLSARQPGSPDYQEATPATRTIMVAKAPATLSLVPETLRQIWDGTPKYAGVTSPTPGLALSGANVVVTYNGNAAPPAAAGRYLVVATLNDPDYLGSCTGTLTISEPAATVPVPDLIPPVVTLDQVSLLTSTTSQVIGGTVSDNVAIDTVLVQAGGAPAVAVSPIGGAWSHFLTGLVPGANALTVTARDLAGNLSAPVHLTVTVEVSLPALTIDPVPAFTTKPSLLLSGTVTTTAGLESLSVQLGSGAIESVAVTAGAWSHTVNPLGSGKNLVTVTARDRAGNRSTTTAAISRVGDLNGDGVVDVADALLAMHIGVGDLRPTPEQLAAGDLAPVVLGVPAPDGVINTGDAVVILGVVVGHFTF